MKFDTMRAKSLLHELNDPRYAGTEGEMRVADFIAGQFEGMGLTVERRAVSGSRFPQRVAPWLGWLGYGALQAAVLALILAGNIPLGILAVLTSRVSRYWLNETAGNRIHVGRNRAPLEKACIVMASPPGVHVAAVRVVFLALQGRRKLEFFELHPWLPITMLMTRVVSGILIWAAVSCEVDLFFRPDDAGILWLFGILTRAFYPAILALTWLGIAFLLSWEYRQSRRSERSHRPERRGLAVLLEIARSWPKAGHRPIEPIFVAAGGDRLDHAGCREVGRLLSSEWSCRPSLLFLFLAPGAGEVLCLFTSEPQGSATQELARDAARSLWIPLRDHRAPARSFPFWPFEIHHPSVGLLGSDPRSFFDESVDPRPLQHAAQLAIEIALRWARQVPPLATTPEPAG
jgi:hypothetical protein